MRTTILSAVVIVLLTACTAAPVDPGQAAVETMVAATLAAVPGEHAIPEEETPPDSPAPDSPEAVPELVLAYTQDDNLWVAIGDAAPQQLTSDGGIYFVMLSDDATRIVYTRSDDDTQQIWLHCFDLTSNSDMLLLDQADLDGLYTPEPGARLTIDTRNLQFLPDSYDLLFSTMYTYEGPGSRPNDDLYRINTSTGDREQLLGVDEGGRVAISPDGSMLALATPTTIHFATIDGSPLGDVRFTFDPVMTYSEYAYVPHAIWSPDGSAIYAVIPSEDPFAPDASARVMHLALDGSPPEAVQMIAGSLFIMDAYGMPWVSPTTTHLAYLQSAGDGGERSLTLAPINGGATTFIAEGVLEWSGWSPEGERYSYRTIGTGATLYIATLGGGVDELPDGRSLRWLPNGAVVMTGYPGDMTLILHRADGSNQPLAVINSEHIAYDAGWR